MRALAVLAPVTAVAAMLVTMPALVVVLGVAALLMALAIMAHGSVKATGPIRASRLGPFVSAMGASFVALWATMALIQ